MALGYPRHDRQADPLAFADSRMHPLKDLEHLGAVILGDAQPVVADIVSRSFPRSPIGVETDFDAAGASRNL